jgi:protein-S-isoprenylcysteine O-methyltransferase Ste14
VVEVIGSHPQRSTILNLFASIGPLVRVAAFITGSLGIVYLSLPSLRRPRSHGFYRAFAFEGLLALLLINIPTWVRDPFSVPQLASWFLLLASAVLAVHGFAILRDRGKPSASLESTTLLVTSGIYRYIRHPLYASLLYLGWGVFLKRPDTETAALVVAVTLFIYLTARAEESENLTKFGADYERYMKTTRRFIPFVL